MSKPVYEYQGIKGLPAISRHTGIPFSCLSYRVHQLKMTITEAVNEGESKANATKYEYKGVHGLRNIANAYNFPHKTLESRVIQLGMDIGEALKKPIRRRVCNGKSGVSKDSLWKSALGIGGSHA
ncbi:hypothetical protein ACEV8A_00740 [Vibrio parahaemolyticus]